MEIGGVSMTKDDVVEIIKDVTWKDFGRHPDFPEAREAAIQALNEVEEYRKIGTLEECREWKENQTTKKVKNSGERIPFEWYCPTCGSVLCDDGYKDTEIAFCENCGQKLDWSDEE